MPRSLPRDDNKIVLRPRGGLNVARTEASTIMAAVFAAAGTTLQESKEDTICTNAAQNIIVVSTPDEDRAKRYTGTRRLCISGREYEVSAYLSAPNGTAKGIIRGIATTDTHEDLQTNIVNAANPLALEAHRIGTSTTVIVVFEGTKVPNYIKYGAILVKCSLYCQHYEVCRCCGKVGHRTDVCLSRMSKYAPHATHQTLALTMKRSALHPASFVMAPIPQERRGVRSATSFHTSSCVVDGSESTWSSNSRN